MKTIIDRSFCHYRREWHWTKYYDVATEWRMLIRDVTQMRFTGIVTSYSSIVLARVKLIFTCEYRHPATHYSPCCVYEANWINCEFIDLYLKYNFFKIKIGDESMMSRIVVEVTNTMPRILVITATNRNGQNLNGHKPKRPQTGTATDRNGYKPKRPQTGTATNRNGHKQERPQTETATNRKGHKPERPQIKIDKIISDSAGYKCVCSIEVSN